MKKQVTKTVTVCDECGRILEWDNPEEFYCRICNAELCHICIVGVTLHTKEDTAKRHYSCKKHLPKELVE